MSYPMGKEAKCNLEESRISLDLERDDDKSITYEAYDVCEVL